jgi:hypothetical protein
VCMRMCSGCTLNESYHRQTVFLLQRGLQWSGAAWGRGVRHVCQRECGLVAQEEEEEKEKEEKEEATNKKKNEKKKSMKGCDALSEALSGWAFNARSILNRKLVMHSSSCQNIHISYIGNKKKNGKSR